MMFCVLLFYEQWNLDQQQHQGEARGPAGRVTQKISCSVRIQEVPETGEGGLQVEGGATEHREQKGVGMRIITGYSRKSSQMMKRSWGKFQHAFKKIGYISWATIPLCHHPHSFWTSPYRRHHHLQQPHPTTSRAPCSSPSTDYGQLVPTDHQCFKFTGGGFLTVYTYNVLYWNYSIFES